MDIKKQGFMVRPLADRLHHVGVRDPGQVSDPLRRRGTQLDRREHGTPRRIGKGSGKRPGVEHVQ